MKKRKSLKLPCDQNCEQCIHPDCIMTDDDIMIALALEDRGPNKTPEKQNEKSKEYYRTVIKPKLDAETPEEREQRLARNRARQAEWRRNNPLKQRQLSIRTAARARAKRIEAKKAKEGKV